MAKFAAKELSGLTADSGSGTPDSFANACKKIEIWGERATEDSCGLHDLQLVFRLALQQYVGKGGLDARNAIQLLHIRSSLSTKSRRADGVKPQRPSGRKSNKKDKVTKPCLRMPSILSKTYDVTC
jgi:hypothetical protein